MKNHFFNRPSHLFKIAFSLLYLFSASQAIAVNSSNPHHLFYVGQEADPLKINENFSETYSDINLLESIFKIDDLSNTILVDTLALSSSSIFDVSLVINSPADNVRGMMPIGSIMPWIPVYSQILPDGWVLCNGAIINDQASPLNGVKLPNLNTNGEFLRGGTQAGIFQTDQIRTHRHLDSGHTHVSGGWPVLLTAEPICTSSDASVYVSGGNTQPADTNVDIPIVSVGNALIVPFKKQGKESVPKNISVFWIMRIK